MRAPNFHTTLKRRLINRKINSYLEKYKFARRFEGMDNDKTLHVIS